jgi:protein O-mannosyl-transferase
MPFFVFKAIGRLAHTMPLRSVKIYACIALVFATALVYGQFLNNPIIFDDLYYFNNGNKFLEQLANPWNMFHLRWLPYATLAWTGKYIGLELINFRIMSLFLHAGVGIALYIFLHNIFKALLPNWNNEQHISLHWLAFFGALIFIYHPLSVYGAAYLIQRTIVLSTLFSLISLNAFLNALSRDNAKTWLIVSLGFYCLAVLSKEHALLLPGIMAAIFITLRKSNKTPIRYLFTFFVTTALVSIFVVLQATHIVGKVYEFSAGEVVASASIESPHLLSILTQSWLYFKYLFLIALPNPAWLSIDMREPLAEQLISLYLLSAIAFISYGICCIWLLFQPSKSKNLTGLTLIYPWIFYFTEFSAIRIQEPFVLYRAYLWMPGLFLVLPIIFQKLSPRKSVITLITLSLIFAAGSINRLVTLSHPFLAWDDAAWLVKDKQNLVGVDRIFYNRGKHLTDSQLYLEAANDFKVAIKLKPNSNLYHFGLAGAFYGLGNFNEAANEFSTAIELDASDLRAYYWRAVCYLKLGKSDLAENDLRLSCDQGWQQSCEQLVELGIN